jgi:hypothetical protein
MVGRGSRITNSKSNFTILDFGNNIRQHNYWEEPRSWSLSKKEKKEGAAPIKECICGYLLYASIMECPECGHIFEKSEQEKEKDIIVELQELSKTRLKNKIEKADFRELELIAIAKGYNKNWIFHQLKNADDFREYGKYKGFKPAWAEMQILKRIV